MGRVFLTGATGFVGRPFAALLNARHVHVTALPRPEGDLLTPATYAAALRGADTVVHLAAVTGRAPDAEYARVNVQGTTALVRAARDAGVSRFLFCSTIAVTFPDRRHYPYAISKAEAEAVVADSGLRWTTVRPTIVAGPGSPVMSRLAALARLPVVPLFDGGRARVQPIHVDDLALLLDDVLQRDRFDGEVLEFGGPDVLSLRDLLGRLRGGRPARWLTIPTAPLRAALAIAEPILGARTPLSRGQLATFRFDGVARENDLWLARRPGLTPIAGMVEP